MEKYDFIIAENLRNKAQVAKTGEAFKDYLDGKMEYFFQFSLNILLNVIDYLIIESLFMDSDATSLANFKCILGKRDIIFEESSDSINAINNQSWQEFMGANPDTLNQVFKDYNHDLNEMVDLYSFTLNSESPCQGKYVNQKGMIHLSALIDALERKGLSDCYQFNPRDDEDWEFVIDMAKVRAKFRGQGRNLAI